MCFFFAARAAHTVSDEDRALLESMQRLTAKVTEMRQQRATYEATLREQVRKDDVTSAIVTQQSGSQDVSIAPTLLLNFACFIVTIAAKSRILSTCSSTVLESLTYHEMWWGLRR